MKIALTGISGLYNYGCEAIVRGTLAILRHKWPDCSVVYPSLRVEEDRRVLRDTDITVLDAYPTVPLVARGYNAMMRRLRLPFRANAPDAYTWLHDVDCVLSIGGDQYTLWPGEEEATEFERVTHAHKVMDAGKPFVLWGASIGPFEANPNAVVEFSQVLRRMPLIIAREATTLNYLRELGISENVAFMADPAYLMAVTARPSSEEQPTIAVNFSPLSVISRLGRERFSEAVLAQAHIVAQLIRNCGATVVLVPHVVCPWQPEDDDYGYLAQVKDAVPVELQDKVRLLPDNLGAIATKQVISSCSLLIAARMHCAIAGLSMAVPTLLLSYSPKSIGMCDYVYGGRDWLLPVNAQPDVIVNVAQTLLGQAGETRRFLNERMVQIKSDALEAADILDRLAL